jgi:hypothetical protein
MLSSSPTDESLNCVRMKMIISPQNFTHHFESFSFHLKSLEKNFHHTSFSSHSCILINSIGEVLLADRSALRREANRCVLLAWKVVVIALISALGATRSQGHEVIYWTRTVKTLGVIRTRGDRTTKPQSFGYLHPPFCKPSRAATFFKT